MQRFLSALTIAGLVALSPAEAFAQPGPDQNQQLTLGTRPTPSARKPVGPLNTLNELFAALSACWKPPAYENARPGMRMTMRFSLKRDGTMIGPPMVTYSTAEVTQKTRETYRDAMLQSLESCMPLRLTEGLGGAIAGRPIIIWVVDPRKVQELKA